MRPFEASVVSVLLALGMSGASFAGPAELAEIQQRCAAGVGMQCDCILAAAAALSEPEQALVAAMFAQDAGRMEVLGPTLTPEQTAGAAAFFQNAAVSCTVRVD